MAKFFAGTAQHMGQEYQVSINVEQISSFKSHNAESVAVTVAGSTAPIYVMKQYDEFAQEVRRLTSNN